ncbi:MAG: hypothetical protein ABIN89_17275, partial [Chitinophagaceae bacterium]
RIGLTGRGQALPLQTPRIRNVIYTGDIGAADRRLIPHTSYLIPHTSNLTPHTSLLLHKLLINHMPIVLAFVCYWQLVILTT